MPSASPAFQLDSFYIVPPGCLCRLYEKAPSLISNFYAVISKFVPAKERRFVPAKDKQVGLP